MGEPHTVVIVGASGGLGSALADVYAEHGFKVRRVDRRAADLADPPAVRRLAAELVGAGGAPDVCIFAAGASEAGYLDEAPPEAFRRSLEVNFLAPVTLFHALATTTACRRFVFVLSGAADVLMPGLAPYALAKRALRDFLDVRALERSFPGRHVLAVRPGAIQTPFDDRTRVHGTFVLPRTARRRSARDVAERIFAAERAGSRRLTLGTLPEVLGRVQALAPGLFGRLMRRHPRFRVPEDRR
jgi:short-subunit dehydrogenase